MRHLLVTGLLFLGIPIRAQSPRTGRVTTINGDVLSVTFVRAEYASPAHEELKAILVVRGPMGWIGIPSQDTTRVRVRTDSLRAMTQVNEVGGGVVTATELAWATYGYRDERLWINHAPVALAGHDTAVVVIVDHTDPSARTSVVRHGYAPWVPTAHAGASSLGPDVPESWWAIIRNDPVLGPLLSGPLQAKWPRS